MEHRRLGRNGVWVSPLCLGTMNFGWHTSEKDSHALMDQALELGINFFDTADVYADGQSEIMLGKILGTKRKDVIVSTKVGLRPGPSLGKTSLSRGHILSSCEGSLRRLGTDYIDLYIVHRFDPHTPIEETLQALDDLVRRGSVRYVGFSNWAAWQAAKAVGIQERHGWARFVGAQMYYSLVGRDIEHEVLPFAEDAGIGTMIWSPLAGGFLSGKYTRENLTAPENRLSGFDLLPFDKERGFALVEVMKEVARAHEASVAQVALAWLLAKRGVSTVLVGATSTAQLEDNLGAVRLRLTPEAVQRLDEASPHAGYYPSWFTHHFRDERIEKALGGRA